MKEIELHIHTGNRLMAFSAEWNECPVGLNKPQPEWLQETGGYCLCRAIDTMKSPVWDHTCPMFGGLIGATHRNTFGYVLCNHK